MYALWVRFLAVCRAEQDADQVKTMTKLKHKNNIDEVSNNIKFFIMWKHDIDTKTNSQIKTSIWKILGL